jgi:hypothetical protein
MTVISRLIGGLGNQMFQYAVGRHLALMRGTRLELDLSWFDNALPDETPRTYGLAPYGIVAGLDGWPLVRRRPAAGYGVTGRAMRRLRLEVGKVMVDREAGFRPAVLGASDGTLLVGHWQTERYFHAIAPTIRAELTLRNPPAGRNADLLAEIRATPSVSVHVRRGDFVSSAATTRAHGAPQEGYHRAAVANIAARTGEAPHAYVFSDDPAWCATHLDLGVPTTVVAHNGDAAPHEDLRLMAACRHHVLANSSFSWWGAWLDPDAGAVVVAPRRWVVDRTRLPDIHADGWLLA